MGGAGPQLPPNVRRRQLIVDPLGLLIPGVWDGQVIDAHKFGRSARLYWTTAHTESPTVLALPGTFEDSCAGDPRTFHYTPHPWDTTLRYTRQFGDVPQPLHFDDW